MNIDRHNYEEWFLLYADDELSAADRREVEAFMERNPDLASELDMFQQMKLDPSEKLSFPVKASLYRQEEEEVSEEDSMLLSYLDGELRGEALATAKHRLASEPALATKLEQFRMTKLPAESIVFSEKSTLYRKSQRTTPVISMRWIRVAVAAAIIISGGVLWFSQQSAVSSQQVGGQQLASNTERPATSNQQPATNNEQPTTNNQQPGIGNPESGIRNHPVTIPAQKRNNDVSGNDVAINNDNAHTTTDNPSTTNNEQPTTNNLPTTYNQQPTTSSELAVNTPTKDGSAVEIVDQPSINTVAKADYATQALLNPDKQDEPVLDEGSRSRKSPFRGLVRKANRLFNKATNPDPDKATVKVASFEISLGR